MRFAVSMTALVTVWLLLFSAAAHGAEIRLKNGDRLTGRLVKLEEGKLTLETEYAGKIKVDWAQVSCLSTEGAHTFRLADDTVVDGPAQCPQDGVLSVKDPETGRTRRLSLSDLAAVNPPPAVRYQGSLTAGGSATSGNTESSALYGTGRLEVRSKKHRVTLSARGNYAENDDTLAARNATGSGKYDYFLSEKLFTYGQVLLEQDELQDLSLRATYGGGLGYQFFDTGRLGLYAEAGASYVNENYDGADNRSYASTRWSVGFDWQVIPDRLKFFHLHEGYVSVDDTQDYYIRSEQGLRIPLIEDLFCNIQVDYDYKNKPAPGKENADLRYLFGLGYSFAN